LTLKLNKLNSGEILFFKHIANMINKEKYLENDKMKNNSNLWRTSLSELLQNIFNEMPDVSIIYWDDKNWKENYQILKLLLWIDKIWLENIKIEQIIDKQIDKQHYILWFLVWTEINWKKIEKNISFIFKWNRTKENIIHIHMSDTKMIDQDWNIIDLWKKSFGSFLGIWYDNQILSRWIPLDWNTPEEIARAIIVKHWGIALQEWANKVIKLFSPNAYLKWTVVKHLSLWDENWVLDYFQHFCAKNPVLKLNKIKASWLTEWKSILAKWEYTFYLDNNEKTEKIPVTWNFTFIFVKRNWNWMIDTLHSSIKYSKEELQKLNQ